MGRVKQTRSPLASCKTEPNGWSEHVQLLLLLIHEQHYWPRTNRRNARKSPKIQSKKRSFCLRWRERDDDDVYGHTRASTAPFFAPEVRRSLPFASSPSRPTSAQERPATADWPAADEPRAPRRVRPHLPAPHWPPRPPQRTAPPASETRAAARYT